MKLRLMLLNILGIVALGAVASAQPAAINGSLTDRNSGLPVGKVRITLRELKNETVSNEKGHFTFSSVPYGSYTLVVSHPAYEKIERVVSSRTDDTIRLQLDPVIFHIAGIVALSTKGNSSSGSQPVPVAVVDGSTFIETSAPTVSDALSREPGVALVRDGMWETGVSIRGMSRNNVVTMVDNTRIETANDLSAALSLINPFDIERIEVMKGANSALAGTGAFGGVVHVLTKSPSFSDKPSLGGEAMTRYESVNNSHAEYLAVESGSENFRFRSSAEYRKADNYATPDGDMPNSQFMDWGVSAVAGVKFFDSHLLDLTYQRFQAENTGLSGGSSFSSTAAAKYALARRELFKAEYTIPGLSRFVPLITLRGSFQDIQRNVEVIQSTILTLTPHAEHKTSMGQAEAVIIPADGHFLTVGIETWERSLDSKREKYNYKTNTILQEAPLPVSSFTSAGIYAQDEWKLTPHSTTIVIGGRYDAIRVHNDLTYDTLYLINALGVKTTPLQQMPLWEAAESHSQSWSANFGVRQELLGWLNASVLISTAFRSPSLEERYQYLNNGGSIHVGNPDLKPEQSRSVDVGVHAQTSLFSADADAYYNSLVDLVSEVPGIFEGSAAYVKTNIGEARMYGYELSAEIRPAASLAFHASVDYVRGEDTKNHANLSQIPPMHGHVTALYAIGRIGNVDIECEGAMKKTMPAAGDSVTAGYALLNAGYSSVPFAFGGASLTFSCGARNILNQAYMDFLSTARGQIRYEPGRNLFASISVIW